eukprot:Phypoly_transcript_20346.p1 GENE.Phypoly_transcript_20346~~Phypoly_transcript_20346.p1  ORF type:complete len:102 (+),score=3.43 Phypoly_transcript_20346:10-315(+)
MVLILVLLLAKAPFLYYSSPLSTFHLYFSLLFYLLNLNSHYSSTKLEGINGPNSGPIPSKGSFLIYFLFLPLFTFNFPPFSPSSYFLYIYFKLTLLKYTTN